jgi:hypothetical protein
MNPFSNPETSLRYEALLDQAFHRDLILLQKLKEAGPNLPALESKNLRKPRGPIEGESRPEVN